MNLIAMFVSEIRNSRCRSAGAMSATLGHQLFLFAPKKRSSAAILKWAKTKIRPRDDPKSKIKTKT